MKIMLIKKTPFLTEHWAFTTCLRYCPLHLRQNNGKPSVAFRPTNELLYLQANKLWQNPINSKKCTYILIYHVFYEWHLNLLRLLWVFNSFVEVLPTTLEFIWRAFSATRRQFNVICGVNSNFSLDVRNMFLPSNDRECIDRKWIKEMEI